MAPKKTIGRNLLPTEEPATLGGAEATEHVFRSSAVAHVKVKVKKGVKAAAKALPDSLPPGDGFTPSRFVINLQLLEGAKAAAGPFHPRFELRVRYTGEDIAAAGSQDNLKVAYYHGGRWTLLSRTLEPDRPGEAASEGYAAIFLDDWPDDPPIAVGR
jgi:hypothetical protein